LDPFENQYGILHRFKRRSGTRTAVHYCGRPWPRRIVPVVNDLFNQIFFFFFFFFFFKLIENQVLENKTRPYYDIVLYELLTPKQSVDRAVSGRFGKNRGGIPLNDRLHHVSPERFRPLLRLIFNRTKAFHIFSTDIKKIISIPYIIHIHSPQQKH
jgi:hypothetical protein